ncbi:MAG: hypothetical protein L0K86_08735 [Actinomycetia bacterium]|nr:hypothetical protein [Actinomycetes bacterium]
MTTLRKFAVSGAAVGALLAPAFVAAPAQADYKASLSIHATDHSVRSGQQFRVHGKYMFRSGAPIKHRMVRVQSKNTNGHWVRLKGAHLRTNSSGHYRIRVILFRKGVRKLRVKAHGPGRRTNPMRSRVIRVRVR